MAYRKHPRHMTDEQFADGTTIDGSRIDKALEDVTEHINAIPKGDMGRRFVQTQYVAGWQPWSAATGSVAATYESHHWPWLPTINYPFTVTGANMFAGSLLGAEPDEIKNKHRFKGIAVPGISTEITEEGVPAITLADAITGVQWAWSRNFHFSSPVIVQDITLHLHADRSILAREPYRNTFQYQHASAAGTPPAGFSAGDGDHGLCVIMDVAHPFTPEDTRMRSVVLLSRGFNTPDSAFSMNAMGVLSSTAPGYVDFFPTFRGGPENDQTETVGGIYHRLTDLNIPLPAGSRARLAVIIPQYDSDVVDSTWGDISGAATPQPYLRPWATQSYSATLTVLEEVFSG